MVCLLSGILREAIFRGKQRFHTRDCS